MRRVPEGRSGLRKKLQKRTFQQWLEWIVPAYARIPLALLVIINLIVYEGTQFLMLHAKHWELALPLDGRIPFRPAWMVIYILAYLQWAVGYVMIARESRERCYRVFMGEIIAKFICGLFFIVMPTRIERPSVEGSGFIAWFTRLVFSADLPGNLFPSIHCLESWFCFRGAIGMKRAPRWYAPTMLALTLLVFASTLLVKQHVLVDIPAGILVAELGLLLSTKLRAGRLLDRLEDARLRRRGGRT